MRIIDAEKVAGGMRYTTDEPNVIDTHRQAQVSRQGRVGRACDELVQQMDWVNTRKGVLARIQEATRKK